MPAHGPLAATIAAHAADVRWRAHNATRRTTIVDAALTLLDRTAAGRDISMGEVAQEAGVAKSVIYRHFSGRDDLFAQMRTRLTEQYFAEVMGQLDISRGSTMEVLTRTISAIAMFMQNHPRWMELARRGPRHDDPIGSDALSSLRLQFANRAQSILDQAALSIGTDLAAFRRLPAAAASMHYGLLQDWLNSPEPANSLGDVVAQLAEFTWHLLDGAARKANLSIDPHLEISELLAQHVAKSPDGESDDIHT